MRNNTTNARSVRTALVVVATALAAFDIAFGWSMDRIFLRSSFNPVAQIEHAAPETLVVGSSGGKYALDPKVLGERNFNASENGQGGFFVAALLKALPAGNGPRRVIFAFDPAEVIVGASGPNARNLVRFTPWAANDPAMAEVISQGRWLERVKLLSGMYRYRGLAPAVIMGWLRPQWSADGFEALTQTMPIDTRVIAKDSTPKPPSPSGLAMLADIAEGVRRHGAELVVVIPPIINHDRAALALYAPSLDAMRQAFAGVRFCDLTNVRDPRLDAIHRDSTLYSDGAHTNAPGAQRYSALVRELMATRCGAAPRP